MTVERRDAPGLFPPPGYSHVASGTGRLVCTAGAVPLDADGNIVADDVAGQTRQTIANVLAALAAGGAGPHDVVKTTVYVVGGGLQEVWGEVRRSELAGAPSTLLGVAQLGYAGQLVEIEAIAIV